MCSLSSEPWLKGPVPNIPPLLQPVAYALLQASEDVESVLDGFDEHFLWVKPAGRASVGFHLQHMAGVLDRMLTYADANDLSEKQLDDLSDEGQAFRNITTASLIQQFHEQVGVMLTYLENTDVNTLTDRRSVGRKKLPSTVIGLLFHAAEHIQRHTGQLLVTVSVVINTGNKPSI